MFLIAASITSARRPERKKIPLRVFTSSQISAAALISTRRNCCFDDVAVGRRADVSIRASKNKFWLFGPDRDGDKYYLRQIRIYLRLITVNTYNLR
jgi:hypothetical protein